MNVEQIMTENVHTVPPTTSLLQLRDIFNKREYRHLLVENEGKLAGVISDRDVLALISPFTGTENETERDRKLLKIPAAHIMSKETITVDRETSIECASILLIENNISCLPVIKGDDSIDGILSWKDLLQYSVYGEKDENPEESAH